MIRCRIKHISSTERNLHKMLLWRGIQAVTQLISLQAVTILPMPIQSQTRFTMTVWAISVMRKAHLRGLHNRTIRRSRRKTLMCLTFTIRLRVRITAVIVTKQETTKTILIFLQAGTQPTDRQTQTLTVQKMIFTPPNLTERLTIFREQEQQTVSVICMTL